MSWYMAKSLDVLLGQLNAKAPKRSKVSDGGIGDAAHSARLSDHNPTASGQVCARDFTNDPAGGLPGQWLADTLVASRDPRIKYVIFNHRIIDSRAGNNPWKWMPYSGTNAHEHHVHVSVFAGALGDNTAPWNLGAGTNGGGGSAPGRTNTEDLMAQGAKGTGQISIPVNGMRSLFCLIGGKGAVVKGRIYYIGDTPSGQGGNYVGDRDVQFDADRPGPVPLPAGVRGATFFYTASADFSAWAA